MEKHKLRSLLLLDLCTFTASLFDSKNRTEALKDFKLAYDLAEKHSLPERKSYQDFMNRL